MLECDNKLHSLIKASKQTIQDYLHGIDDEFDNTDAKAIKLVRHADSRTKLKKGKIQELLINGETFPSNIRSIFALYLYRKDLFLKYQGEQSDKTYKGIKYVVSFIGESGTTARFVGVYKITGVSNSPFNNEEVIYDMEPVEAFSSLEEKLIIDWGKATTSWHQYFDKIKPVILEDDKISRDIVLPKPASMFDAIFSFPQMKQIVQNPDWVEQLKEVNCIYGILDNKTGKLYVGSTYGTAGILGRWEAYANTGHGDDKDLNRLISKDPSYAMDNFQWSILEILALDVTQEDAIERESIWKKKLGTRTHGYNNN